MLTTPLLKTDTPSSFITTSPKSSSISRTRALYVPNKSRTFTSFPREIRFLAEGFQGGLFVKVFIFVPKVFYKRADIFRTFVGQKIQRARDVFNVVGETVVGILQVRADADDFAGDAFGYYPFRQNPCNLFVEKIYVVHPLDKGGTARKLLNGAGGRKRGDYRDVRFFVVRRMQSDADVRPRFVGRIKRFSAAPFALRLSFGNDRCKVAATVFQQFFRDVVGAFGFFQDDGAAYPCHRKRKRRLVAKRRLSIFHFPYFSSAVFAGVSFRYIQASTDEVLRFRRSFRLQA